MRMEPLTEQDRALIDTAMDALKRNFDDGVFYHTVGAAIRCTNGHVYAGVNCDGIHGSCAEFIAIGAAITAGERQFDAITAVHLKAHNNLVPPCGNCRQMLFEYCPDIRVILNGPDGSPVKVPLKELLPLAYVEVKE
nr:cytidine deaminase [bacterium]